MLKAVKIKPWVFERKYGRGDTHSFKICLYMKLVTIIKEVLFILENKNWGGAFLDRKENDRLCLLNATKIKPPYWSKINSFLPKPYRKIRPHPPNRQSQIFYSNSPSHHDQNYNS